MREISAVNQWTDQGRSAKTNGLIQRHSFLESPASFVRVARRWRLSTRRGFFIWTSHQGELASPKGPRGVICWRAICSFFLGGPLAGVSLFARLRLQRSRSLLAYKRSSYFFSFSLRCRNKESGPAMLVILGAALWTHLSAPSSDSCCTSAWRKPGLSEATNQLTGYFCLGFIFAQLRFEQREF